MFYNHVLNRLDCLYVIQYSVCRFVRYISQKKRAMGISKDFLDSLRFSCIDTEHTADNSLSSSDNNDYYYMKRT